MLTFYRPNKWTLPAMVSQKDLSLLSRIKNYQVADERFALKKQMLVHDFHQTNLLATTGCFVGILLTIFIIYIGWEDLAHYTKNTMVTAVVALSGLVVVGFCCLVRMLGMWFVRRKFIKFGNVHV